MEILTGPRSATVFDFAETVDRDALNWKPYPDANSIAVLITHTLESEP